MNFRYCEALRSATKKHWYLYYVMPMPYSLIFTFITLRYVYHHINIIKINMIFKRESSILFLYNVYVTVIESLQF